MMTPHSPSLASAPVPVATEAGSPPAPLILVASLGQAHGSRAAAAALGCALSQTGSAALLIDLGGTPPRPTLLSTPAARELEGRLHYRLPGAAIAARGQLCHIALPPTADGLREAAQARSLPGLPAAVLHLRPSLLASALSAEPTLEPCGVLLRAELDEDHSLVAATVRDLRGRGLATGVLKRRLDWASERRALFGALAPGALPERLVARLLGHPAACTSSARSLLSARLPARAGAAHAPQGGCDVQD
jgi:hypothetical protein